MLIPLAACLWLLITRKAGERGWEKVCDPQLLPHVLIHGQGRQHRTFITLFGIAGLLVIIALAGPAWERLPQPLFRSESALVIVMDLSRSMDATDVAPSRLERARYKVVDILEQREQGETALIVYAGDAFTVTPLTSDTETIKSQLPALSTSLMPIQGHRADLALERAASLMKQAGHARGQIILVTDEVDPERDGKKAAQVFNEGYRVSVLGIGTEQGAPIRLDNGGFLKNRAGEIVVPVLNHKQLRDLASVGGGLYRSLTPTNDDVLALTARAARLPQQGHESDTGFTSDVWQEHGPWLLLLIIPLAALSFRRGVILILAVGLVPLSRPAQALDWDGLWLNEDQRAQRLLEQGESHQASELFTDERWKAAAQYRAGDYESSIETLNDVEDTESLYNKGNALARLGQYQEAIAAYERVLDQNPEHEDAQYNLDLIKKELDKQQPPPQQDPSGGGEKQPPGDDQQQGEQKQDDSPPPQDQTAADNQKSQQPADRQQQETQGDEQVSSGDQEQQQKGEEDRSDQGGRPGEETGKQAQQRNEEQKVAGNEAMDEESRATEQWLRRIPDDPGGLLREKFRLQYKQRGLTRHNYEQDW